MTGDFFVDSPKLTTQQQIVADYLTKGCTITNAVALTCLGVGSLSSRIAELRKLGYQINTRTERDRFGRSFKKYDLQSSDDIATEEAAPSAGPAEAAD